MTGGRKALGPSAEHTIEARMRDEAFGPPRDLPDPNRFVEDPPRALPSATAIRIDVSYYTDPGRPEGTYGLTCASNAEIAFYLRLKSTPGCTSKMSPGNDSMALYIEPGSEAAVLFVSRLIRKLPPGPRPPEVESRIRALLPEEAACRG